MVKPTIAELKALSAIKNHPDFKTIVDWFIRSHQIQSMHVIHCKEDCLYRWGQGKCQELEEILYHIDNTEKLIKTINDEEEVSKEKTKSVL